jgi:hypothetical protein
MARVFGLLAEILLTEAKEELPLLVNGVKKELPKHVDDFITDEMEKSFKDKFFPTKTSKLDPKTLEKAMESWPMPRYSPEHIRIGDEFYMVHWPTFSVHNLQRPWPAPAPVPVEIPNKTRNVSMVRVAWGSMPSTSSIYNRSTGTTMFTTRTLLVRTGPGPILTHPLNLNYYIQDLDWS